MSGLILLAALIAFIVFLIWVSGLMARRLKISAGWKTFLRMVFVVGVFPLMIMDEIVGKSQFDSLCQSGATFRINAAGIRGQTVRVSSSQTPLANVAIPITSTEIIYTDTQSQDVLAKVIGFRASSGWLARTITQSDDWPPLIFARSTCWPELGGRLEDTYQFSVLK